MSLKKSEWDVWDGLEGGKRGEKILLKCNLQIKRLKNLKQMEYYLRSKRKQFQCLSIIISKCINFPM